MEATNPEGAGGKEGGGKSEKPDVEKGRERANVREGERGHLSFSTLWVECGFSAWYLQESRFPTELKSGECSFRGNARLYCARYSGSE